VDLIELIHQTRLELWFYQLTEWRINLFTIRWWMIIPGIAAAYTIWWKYVDKDRLSQILLFGSFIAVFRVIMDDAGASAALWVYTVKPLPLGHALFLNDLTIVPLGFMLVYQYCHSWKTFFLWSVITEAGYSFILLPVLTYFDILRIYNWQYSYTFFIMLAVVSIMRAIILTVLRIERSSKYTYSPAPFPSSVHPAMKPLEPERIKKQDD